MTTSTTTSTNVGPTGTLTPPDLEDSRALAVDALETLRSAQVDTAAHEGRIGTASGAYSVVLGLVLFTVMGWSVLRGTVIGPGESRFIADPRFLATGTTATAFGLIVLLALAAGPLNATRPVRSWLVSTPADRAVLIRGSFITVAAACGVIGGAAGAFSAAIGREPPLGVFSGTVLGFISGSAIVTVLAAIQDRPTSDTVLRLAGLAAIGIGSLTLALGVLPGWSTVTTLRARPEGAATLDAARDAALALVLIVLILRFRRKVGDSARRLHVGQLARGGDFVDALGISTLMLDSTPVRVALYTRRAPRRGYLPHRIRSTGAPALAELDAVRVLRRGTSLLVALAVLPLPATVSAMFGTTGGTWAAALIAYLVAIDFAEGLFSWTRSDSIRRSLPLPDAACRTALLAAPLAVGATWLALALALARVDMTIWPILVAAVAAGVVRSAEARDTSSAAAGMVSTPMGVIPLGLILLAIRGFDLILLPGILLTLGQPVLAFFAAVLPLTHLLTREAGR